MSKYTIIVWDMDSSRTFTVEAADDQAARSLALDNLSAFELEDIDCSMAHIEIEKEQTL